MSGSTPEWHTAGRQPLTLRRKPAPKRRRAVELPSAAATSDALRRVRKETGKFAAFRPADPDDRQQLEQDLSDELRALEAKPF